MRISYYILIPCLCFAATIWGQNSINQELKAPITIKENTVASLLRVADSLVTSKNFRLAEEYTSKAFDLAQKSGVQRDIIDTGIRLAHFLSSKQNKHKQAEEIIDLLTQYCTEKSDTRCKIRSTIVLGNIKKRKLQFIEALKHFNKAIEQLEHTEYDRLLWYVHTSRGQLLLGIGDMAQSRKDFKKARKYMTEQMSVYDRSITYTNIAASFPDKQPDSIMYYSRFAATNCVEDKTSRHCNLTYNNIAWSYFLKGMPKQALDIIQTHIDFDKIDHRDSDSLYAALMHTLGAIYFELKQYKKAIKHFEIADTYFLKNQDIAYLVIAKEDLSRVYEALGDFKSSIAVLREIKPLNSKLDSLKINREIARIESKKLLDVKEAKIINLEQENIQIVEKIYKTRTFSYFLVAFLIVALSAFLYKGHKNKIKFHQLNEELSVNRFKSLRSVMNPHFLFNSFSTLQNYILKKENLKANEYMTEFSGLIRNILSSSDSMYITFQNELEILQSYIKIEQERFNKSFEVFYDIDQEIVLSNPKIPSMVVQPYIENAIIHGFSHSENESLLKITFKKKGNSMICKVLDNGIGRDKAMQIKQQRNSATHLSIASRNTDERLRILDRISEQSASVTTFDLFYESGEPKGTEVVIVLPIMDNKLDE